VTEIHGAGGSDKALLGHPSTVCVSSYVKGYEDGFNDGWNHGVDAGALAAIELAVQRVEALEGDFGIDVTAAIAAIKGGQ
jgi:hypothetical protein